MSVFAAIHVVLPPTAAANSVTQLLHIQQFSSFSPDVGERLYYRRICVGVPLLVL